MSKDLNYSSTMILWNCTVNVNSARIAGGDDMVLLPHRSCYHASVFQRVCRIELQAARSILSAIITVPDCSFACSCVNYLAEDSLHLSRNTVCTQQPVHRKFCIELFCSRLHSSKFPSLMICLDDFPQIDVFLFFFHNDSQWWRARNPVVCGSHVSRKQVYNEAWCGVVEASSASHFNCF